MVQANEWWKWFWRFAVLVELSGVLVGFLALSAFPSSHTLGAMSSMEQLGAASMMLYFGIVTLITLAVCVWGLCVTVPVLLVSEICFWRARRVQEERAGEEAIERAFTGDVLGGVHR